MTTQTNDKKQEPTQKKKSNLWPVLLGSLGFIVLYTGVSTDDDRMKLPKEQAKELASEGTTTAMEFAGVAAMLGAILWADKRKNER